MSAATADLAEVDLLAKSKTPNDPPEPASKQLALRMPMEDWKRIQAAANAFGLDDSNFLRMLIRKSLPTFEEEARQILAGIKTQRGAERRTKGGHA